MNASATYETTFRVSDRCTMLVHVDWSDGDRLGISAPRCCAAATCRRGAP